VAIAPIHVGTSRGMAAAETRADLGAGSAEMLIPDVTSDSAFLSSLQKVALQEAHMARISLDPPRTLLYRVLERYSMRTYGDVLDPGRALAHNSRVIYADLRFERAVAKFNKLDPVLKEFAVMAAAAHIGCSWCMDFGYWEAHKLGIAQEKLRAVPAWREHRELFSELEIAVMEYAEAMCESEPTVDDEMSSHLLKLLGEAAFVELTFMVGLENLRSRVNSALGLRSQGFSDRCASPAVPSRQ
jgi:AhpD family alkylhydroperoxidase